MTSYTISSEYEPRPFDSYWPEVSTIVDCLSYTEFCQRWRDKYPKLMIKSQALDFCDTCYICRNYYKSIKKESYEKPDDLIDDYDDDVEDDSVYGYGNELDVITYVELEVKNTQCKKSKQHY